MSQNLAALMDRLNDFDPALRRETVRTLAESLSAGKVPTTTLQPVCNIHAHTFYSYNAYGYSPAYLAFLARREGIPIMGIIDLDIIEGIIILDALNSNLMMSIFQSKMSFSLFANNIDHSAP
jgi:hypothetical protein